MNSLYRTCLAYPGVMLAVSLTMAAVLCWGIRDFQFDASADTLVVEGDPGLARYREMAELFGGDEFVVITYTTNGVVKPAALSEIRTLQGQLSGLPGVSRSFSILDIPLIESPPIPLASIADEYRTLGQDEVDLDLARAELTRSPLVSNYLISEDASTTAIVGMLDTATDSNGDRHESVDRTAIRVTLIERLREIRDNYPGEATLFISGVPMIAADMLAYVRSDLQTFGGLVLLLIVLLLSIFFRKPRWVVIPVFICLVTVATTMGILGYLGTPVTVISSNFISLLSIISISFAIHLVVRFRELISEGTLDHAAMVLETMRSKFTPCLYTALTTVLAFGSMLASGIQPVVDFGWMMCVGIVNALIVTFLLFPAIVLLLGPTPPSSTLGQQIRLAQIFRFLSVQKTGWVIGVSGLLAIVGLYGLTLLSFDNRFTDYFDRDTDIYQGMHQIDRQLGGTLPLDVYVRFEKFDATDAVDEDDFFSDNIEAYPERYWYTAGKIETLRSIEDVLRARPEVGKIISLAAMEEMARGFNDGEALTSVEMAYILGELPADIRHLLIDPYALPETGWMRINARITESLTAFSKDELITDIQRHAEQTLQLPPDRVIVTGMIVMFNDMLKQLAASQAGTLGYVLAATFIMFLLLLRSLRYAVIALVPNMLAALLIVSTMGFAGIALDMMTVTIAAICIGIGVDDAIHYLHRFIEELSDNPDVSAAVGEAHATIGRAMYFTTVTVMAGFSVLAFSNFIPTVMFGLLTALAMALALIANMTLLPALLITFSGSTHRSPHS